MTSVELHWILLIGGIGAVVVLARLVRRFQLGEGVLKLGYVSLAVGVAIRLLVGPALVDEVMVMGALLVLIPIGLVVTGRYDPRTRTVMIKKREGRE